MDYDKFTPASTRANSHKSSYYVGNQAKFIPPPIGLKVVSMPHKRVFNLFLSGHIDATQVLKIGSGQEPMPKFTAQQLNPTPIRRLGNHNLFDLVGRMQCNTASEQSKQKHTPDRRKITLNRLTYSTRETIYPERSVSEISSPQLPYKGNLNLNTKEATFIRRCEILGGEQFKDEEIKLLLKQNITDKDMWLLMNKFQKKKWFFDYIQRNLGSNTEGTPKSLLQKVRYLVNKTHKKPKRKKDEQCQEYYKHIINIQEQIKDSIFERKMPQKTTSNNTSSVKLLRQESQVEKLRIRGKFNEVTQDYAANKSKQDILNDVFDFQDATQKPVPYQMYKLHKKTLQLSRSDDLSHDSQNDTLKSVTEFQLNELYSESKVRQKNFKKEIGNVQQTTTGDQLQRKVKQIVKIGHIQDTILNVVAQKLKY